MNGSYPTPPNPIYVLPPKLYYSYYNFNTYFMGSRWIDHVLVLIITVLIKPRDQTFWFRSLNIELCPWIPPGVDDQRETSQDSNFNILLSSRKSCLGHWSGSHWPRTRFDPPRQPTHASNKRYISYNPSQGIQSDTQHWIRNRISSGLRRASVWNLDTLPKRIWNPLLMAYVSCLCSVFLFKQTRIFDLFLWQMLPRIRMISNSRICLRK